MNASFWDEINLLVFQSAHLVMSQKCLEVAKEAEWERGDILLVYQTRLVLYPRDMTALGRLEQTIYWYTNSSPRLTRATMIVTILLVGGKWHRPSTR
jgi:hypothetical protein